MQTSGIHHVTSITPDAQKTVDFYAGILAFRLVKRTVNFDDPGTYHLYFGNEVGGPGTALTFFPYPTSRKGRLGGGQVAYTGFAAPPGSLPFWEERLNKFSIPYTVNERFGEKVLRFSDWDGLQNEIVERAEGAKSQWSFSGVSTDEALKGFSGAVLYSTSPEETIEALESVMGLKREGEEQGLLRLRAPGDLGNTIDVHLEAQPAGHGGHGTVHHIAWRAKDAEEQLAWGSHVSQAGFHPTPVQDRNYFTSIYFREHGGILFEIATDTPGFARDEPVESLGEKLMLPSWYEPHRKRIEESLPAIEVRELEVGE